MRFDGSVQIEARGVGCSDFLLPLTKASSVLEKRAMNTHLVINPRLSVCYFRSAAPSEKWLLLRTSWIY